MRMKVARSCKSAEAAPRVFVIFCLCSSVHSQHRFGDSHEETSSARSCLARNLRLQLRDDEADDVERVRSWSKIMPSCGSDPQFKRKREESN
jgi:hypothetical protein